MGSAVLKIHLLHTFTLLMGKLWKIVLNTFSDQNLYFRRKCRCAESTGMKVNDSLCNHSCKNAPSSTCGNGVYEGYEGYSSVYKTGRQVLYVQAYVRL